MDQVQPIDLLRGEVREQQTGIRDRTVLDAKNIFVRGPLENLVVGAVTCF
jgi:hypothetical protein